MASVAKLLRALRAFRARAIDYDAGAADIGVVVDRLGRISAARAELEIYEKALKEIIVTKGDKALEGQLFRTTLSVYAQERVDTKALRADVDAAWLEKYLRSQTITKVAVHARSGLGLDTPASQPAAAE
jgi:hypothetical protein